MTVELNIFSGMLEPKKGSLEKNKDLSVYAGTVRAKNKSAAQVMLHGIFLQSAPELADDYFKPKVWEDDEGIPRPELMGVLIPDFFSDEIVWNAETGKPERVLVEPELADDGEQLNDGATEEKMTAVKSLPSNYRAASLVLFGPVEEITATQYGQVMDLVNDDESSFARELAEAIAREPRVLALLPERQEGLLAHLRETVKETAQWTDIKRPINKWLDTPPAKREQTNADGGAKLSIDDHKQRSIQLRYQVACGVIARSMDFDVLSPPIGIEVRANSILSDKNDTEVTDWFVPFSRTPGVYDFSPVTIVAIIKTAEDKISHYPGETRKYIDKCIAGFDCVNPPQLVIDIACGHTSAPLPQKNDGAKPDGKTEQTLQDENLPPAACPARAAELDRELEAAFANNEQTGSEEQPSEEKIEYALTGRPLTIKTYTLSCVNGYTSAISSKEAGKVLNEIGLDFIEFSNLCAEDISRVDDATPLSDDEIFQLVAGALRNWHLLDTAEDRCEYLSNLLSNLRAASGGDARNPMDDREIEIAHALSDLLSGRTDIMGKEEAEGVVTCTGHLIADVLPLLIIDIATTEFCLSPNFSDEEIHDVATTILDGWSDDAAVRQKVSLDAIVEYRRPEPPKAVVINPPVISVKPKKEPEPTPAPTAEPVALTYRQQLTLAALQGMCANPAYRGDFDDLPHMAVMLATEVISAESGQ